MTKPQSGMCRRKRAQSLAAAALAACGLPGAAQAALIETSSMSNYVSYSTNYRANAGNGGTSFGAGDFRFSDSHSSNAGGFSFIDIGVTTRLGNDGGFFFLHNATCVGSCYIDIYTELTFRITNTGDTPEELDFHSLITPGHLARQNYVPGQGEATFNFQIFDVGTYTNSVTDALYSALGEANPNPAKIRNGQFTTTDPTYTTKNGSTFAAQAQQKSNEGVVLVGGGPPATAPNYNVVDWSATGVGVRLPTIEAGQTRTIKYVLNTYIANDDPCLVASECSGFQIAFGDPRDQGTVQGPTPAMRFGGPEAPASAFFNPVVGAAYDPYSVTVALVAPDSPVANLPANDPIIYNGTFVVTAAGVPEPSTWAMMIVGFGAVGFARRRGERAGAPLVA